MAANHDVSVVIPGRNVAWCIPQLAKNLEQACEGCEVIFVDDGSRDGSAEMLLSLYPRARILRLGGRGVGAARNRGVEAASRDFIQLLDADDTVVAGKFDAQLAAIHADKTDVAYSDWRMLEVHGCDVTIGQLTKPGTKEDVVAALLSGWWFPTASALTRRSAYLACGGCDENLHDTCDDFHLWVQLAINGARFTYTPGHLSNYHRYHGRTSVSRRNREAFFRGEATIIENALHALQSSGQLTSQRRNAAALRFHDIARNVYRFDRSGYQDMMRRIANLNPQFAPRGSRVYRTLWATLGADASEWLATAANKLTRSR